MEMGRLDPATGQNVPLMSAAGRSPTASPVPSFNQAGPGRGQDGYMGIHEMGAGQRGQNFPVQGGGPYGRGTPNGFNGNARGFGEKPGSSGNGRGQGYPNGGQQFARSPTGYQNGNASYQTNSLPPGNGPNQAIGGAGYGRAQPQRQFSNDSNRPYGPPQRQLTGGDNNRPFPAPQRQMTDDGNRPYLPQQRQFSNDMQGPPPNLPRQNTGESYSGNNQPVNRRPLQNNNIGNTGSNIHPGFDFSQSSRTNDNYRGTPPPQAQFMPQGTPMSRPPQSQTGFGGGGVAPQEYTSYSPPPMEVQQPTIPELGATGANGAAYPGYKIYTPPLQQPQSAYRPPPILMPGGGSGVGQPPRNWTPDNL